MPDTRQRLVLTGGSPGGVWACASCRADLCDGLIVHRHDCEWLAAVRTGAEPLPTVEQLLARDVPLRIKFVKGYPVPVNPAACEPHTPSPRGYLEWDEWAERMEQTHTQRQCKGCGLWSVWEPRETATQGDPDASQH